MTDITGTEGQDDLHGTSGDDVIAGLAGDDFLYGEDGNDVLKGGSGGDVICDRLDIHDFSPNGADRMFGGSGDDQLVSFEGQDTLMGGKGNDDLVIYRHIEGNDDKVIADGGAGNDSFWFSSYNAGAHIKLEGGAGDDSFDLWGSKGTLHVDLGLAGHDAVYAASRYADGDGPIAIGHFEAGDDGDLFSLYGAGRSHPKYVDGFINWNPNKNPFADGHLELIQHGANAELWVDPDGGGDNYHLSVIFRGVDAADFTAANFSGFDPHATADGLIT